MSDALSGAFGQTLVLAVGATRAATAFLLMPVLSPDIVPPLVRNSIFLAFSVMVLALQPGVATLQLTTPDWIALFAREAMIGLVIGFLFGTMLWAFEAAGQIVDAKVGATMAQIVDPLTGHQTSLNGAFLSRLAGFVFMFSGGLLLLATALLDSYAIWPIAAAAPRLRMAATVVFEGEFSRLMTLATLIAAPTLIVLFLVEAGMGLVNRFAPQLNVFSLSLSIKAWLATLMLLATSGVLIQMLLDEIFSRPAAVGRVLSGFATP